MEITKNKLKKQQISKFYGINLVLSILCLVVTNYGKVKVSMERKKKHVHNKTYKNINDNKRSDVNKKKISQWKKSSLDIIVIWAHQKENQDIG